jgi:hypothetical protein
VDEGVYQLPAGPLKDRFKTIVWTLVDSDESKEGVPDYLVSRGTSLFVIYSTSPARERWSRMHKTVRETIVIMNPWSKAEIYRAYDILNILQYPHIHTCSQCAITIA